MQENAPVTLFGKCVLRAAGSLKVKLLIVCALVVVVLGGRLVIGHSWCGRELIVSIVIFVLAS